MIRFSVPDMRCGACANRIGRALAQADLPTDLQLEIDVAGKQVRLYWPAGASEPRAAHRGGPGVARAVREAIEGAGYTALPDIAPWASANVERTGGCCCAAQKAGALEAEQTASMPAAGCCS